MLVRPHRLGQTHGVPFRKLTSTDAFVVTDLADAPFATGVVRRARKILPDGARLLARTGTYAWAVHRQQVSGASAGINAEDDGAAEAVAAFVTELTADVTAGTLSLSPAKGVTVEQFAPLVAVDPFRSTLERATDAGTLGDLLLAAGVAAAADRALGGLDGRTVALETTGPSTAAVAAALAARGAVVEQLDRAAVLASDADVLCCGSATGMVDHTVAADLAHRVVVPVGPVPVTARGLAVARRRDITVLPDFVTTSGPLVAHGATDEEDEALVTLASDTVGGLVGAILDHPENPTLGACALAEEFLSTWQPSLPFGRPMA